MSAPTVLSYARPFIPGPIWVHATGALTGNLRILTGDRNPLWRASTGTPLLRFLTIGGVLATIGLVLLSNERLFTHSWFSTDWVWLPVIVSIVAANMMTCRRRLVAVAPKVREKHSFEMRTSFLSLGTKMRWAVFSSDGAPLGVVQKKPSSESSLKSFRSASSTDSWDVCSPDGTVLGTLTAVPSNFFADLRELKTISLLTLPDHQMVARLVRPMFAFSQLEWDKEIEVSIDARLLVALLIAAVRGGM